MELKYFHQIFYGLLILGCVTKGLSQPLAEDENNHHNGTPIAEDDVSDLQSDDIDQMEYNDDDGGSIPTPTAIGINNYDVTEPPYLVQKEYTKKARPGDNVTLECTVKNLGASNVVLWYKENVTIAAGAKPIGNNYLYDAARHNLIIMNAKEKDSGSYYCIIQPQKLQVRVHVEISDTSNYADPAEAQSNSNILIPTFCTLLLTGIISRI